MSLQLRDYHLREYNDSDRDEVITLLPRLNKKGYDINPDTCTHVVVIEQAIVGAFNASTSNYRLDEVFRLYWLVAKDGTRGVGAFIVQEACEFAKVRNFTELYASYNINNDESVSLFERQGFVRLKSSGETGETDSKKLLS